MARISRIVTCLLLLVVACQLTSGNISPITHALAAKSSATVFSPPIDNPCTQDWTGPSADNSFDCDGSSIVDWLLDNRLWQFGIPLAVSILICFPGCCIVLCGRYCCGCVGSSKQRPGHCCCGGKEMDDMPEDERELLYSRCCINTTKCWAFFVALMGLAGVALCIAGGVRIALGVSETTSAVEELVNWFLQVIGDAQEGLRDSDGNYPNGFDLGMFDDVANSVRDAKREYFTDGIELYRTAILAGSLSPAFVSIVPALLLFLPAVAALTNNRRMPTVVVFASFPMQFIYFFVVTLLLIVLVPLDIVCEDLEAEPNEKSIMQWYIVPYCDSESPFKSIIDNVNDMELENSVEGCEKLLEFCSTTPAWSFTSPDLVFYCNITNATECRTLEDIVSKVDGMVVKVGAPEDCNGNASGCTLRQCAIDCNNTNARSSAADAVAALDTAQRVLHAFETILLPWLDCGRLIKKLLGLGPRQMCSSMRGGFSFFKDGSIIIASGAVVAMIVSMFGEKRFFDPNRASYANSNNNKAVPPLDAAEMGSINFNQNSQSRLGLSQSASYRPSAQLMNLKEQYAAGIHSPAARALAAARQYPNNNNNSMSMNSNSNKNVSNPLTASGRQIRANPEAFVLPEEASPSKPAEATVMM